MNNENLIKKIYKRHYSLEKKDVYYVHIKNIKIFINEFFVRRYENIKLSTVRY